MEIGLAIMAFKNIKTFVDAYHKGGYTIVLDDADTDIDNHVYSVGYILDCIACQADDGMRFCEIINEGFKKGGETA